MPTTVRLTDYVTLWKSFSLYSVLSPSLSPFLCEKVSVMVLTHGVCVTANISCHWSAPEALLDSWHLRGSDPWTADVVGKGLSSSRADRIKHTHMTIQKCNKSQHHSLLDLIMIASHLKTSEFGLKASLLGLETNCLESSPPCLKNYCSTLPCQSYSSSSLK